jgi:hypothetical protein
MSYNEGEHIKSWPILGSPMAERLMMPSVKTV